MQSEPAEVLGLGRARMVRNSVIKSASSLSELNFSITSQLQFG